MGAYNEPEVKILDVTIEVWGDFACFSPPYSKVERLTYPFPTPSAARGIFSAIYAKPKEFVWEIRRIEVLSDIQYISFKRNEVKAKVSNKPIFTDEERTQRQTVALKDVRYRITAEIVPRAAFVGRERQLYEQAMRRIRSGKCFFQPSLGLREFVAYFEESDGTQPAKKINMDIGWMVYDVFDLHDFSVSKKTKPKLSLFHAVLKDGVLEVPPYDSPEVVKGEDVNC
ncbi:MAG: type I-C CRISPR-associated protein Cas5 [Clostridia bacterium]|nr:type I-C CRISPR-associated protein Cas5 [Clostridia bacterium]